MPLHRQTVRTGQPGWPCPYNGDGLASRRRAGEGMQPGRHQTVGRIALQPPDIDRLALGNLAHAGLFAERLRRADTGAHPAEDVLAEDCLGRRIGRACRDLADEQRYVDIRGTGRDAGRVVTEIAAIRRHQRLVIGERRMQIDEPRGKIGRLEPPRHNPLCIRFCVHVKPPLFLVKTLAQVHFFINW